MNPIRQDTRAWLVRILDHPVATRLTSVGTLVAVLFSCFLWTKQYSYAECVARYNDRSSRSTSYRIGLAEEDRRAQDQLFAKIVSATEGSHRGQAFAALREYVDSRQEIDAKRKANTPPAPPSEVCH